MALAPHWPPEASLRKVPLPPGLPGRGNALTRWLAWQQFRLRGWDIRGRFPEGVTRLVVIVAPHTSNWDMINGMAAQFALGIRFHFLIKAEWFRWPLVPLLRWLGAIPINRGAGSVTTQSIVNTFAQRDPFVMLITPEGTRAPVNQLKPGFFYIARVANVPLLVISYRYAEKQICLDGLIPAGDDFAALEAQLKAHFAPIKGLHGRFPAEAAVAEAAPSHEAGGSDNRK